MSLLSPDAPSKQKEWLTENCRKLKHEKGGVGELLTLMKELKQEKTHSKTLKEKLQTVITYYQQFSLWKIRRNYGSNEVRDH